MSSDEEEQNDEVLGTFFDAHYSQLLNFLPSEDIKMMSVLNQKWNQRVESHKMWVSIMSTIQGNKMKIPKKEEKIVEKVTHKEKKIERNTNQSNNLVKESKLSKRNLHI